jgi:hypothetical protein
MIWIKAILVFIAVTLLLAKLTLKKTRKERGRLNVEIVGCNDKVLVAFILG